MKKRVMLAGDVLRTHGSPSGSSMSPMCRSLFDAKGAREFDRITGENVKKRMAIVLDNTIYSAPVIQSASAADAQITGTFSMEEANNLSIVLRLVPCPGLEDHSGSHRWSSLGRTRSKRASRRRSLRVSLGHVYGAVLPLSG